VPSTEARGVAVVGTADQELIEAPGATSSSSHPRASYSLAGAAASRAIFDVSGSSSMSLYAT